MIRCINANDATGITKGKFYEELDDDGKYVKIVNDNGEVVHYKLRRFKSFVV